MAEYPDFETVDYKTCEERVDAALASEVNTLGLLLQAYRYDGQVCPVCAGDNEHCQLCEGDGWVSEDLWDYGNFWQYPLDFSYMPGDRFPNQTEPYFLYQISTGGPGDEFRFFAHQEARGRATRWVLDRVEYWYLDWHDGAHRTLSGKALEVLEDVWEQFVEVGSVDAAIERERESAAEWRRAVVERARAAGRVR